MSLAPPRQAFRDACIELNAATSKTDISNALSNVYMKNLAVNSAGNIAPVDVGNTSA